MLPNKCRATVLSLAHSIPLADHLAGTRRLNVSYSGSIGQLYTETSLSTAGPVNHARRWLNVVYNQHHSFASLLLILHSRELLYTLLHLSLAVSQGNDAFWSCVTTQAVALRSIDAEHIAEELFHIF